MTPRIGIYRNIFSVFCLKFQKGKLFGNHNISHFRKNPHLEQKSLFPREVPTVLPTVVGRSSKAAGLLTATCVQLSHLGTFFTQLSVSIPESGSWLFPRLWPLVWFLLSVGVRRSICQLKAAAKLKSTAHSNSLSLAHHRWPEKLMMVIDQARIEKKCSRKSPSCQMRDPGWIVFRKKAI